MVSERSWRLPIVVDRWCNNDYTWRLQIYVVVERNINVTEVPFDDHKLILGMDFFIKAKAIKDKWYWIVDTDSRWRGRNTSNPTKHHDEGIKNMVGENVKGHLIELILYRQAPCVPDFLEFSKTV